MMCPRLVRIALVSALLLVPYSLPAQDLPGQGGLLIGGGIGLGQMAQTNRELQKVIRGRVYGPNAKPLDKAHVEVTNNAGSPYQQVVTDKTGDFFFGISVFDVNRENNFIATIKVTRKGYQIGHKIVFMDKQVHDAAFTMSLRPIGPEDAMMLSPDQLIDSLAPR